ncbi:MarR family transcriptional regulator [Actinocatenispora thailandica]|uniref:MarR family transcriptional regulator n=1 Tax=Actinocatenispora thailandica TaxID=227318 RepID=A0A7R7HZQ1_9ACTN|nr:MarR family transcriptional regulator [Actinocatenispora thailandica]BCJ38587.1 MarR family transcriptional regulator [Actinocatenispora thailandica]
MARSAALSPEEWEFWDRWMTAQRLLAGEVDRTLQRDFGISKAEFSVLVTLHRAPGNRLRVTELADSLGWDKSRVAHQLTRMERRGLLDRTESGAAGRRTGIGLTGDGRDVVQRAISGHAHTIRRLALDPLSPDQAAAIRAWSRQLIDRLDPTSPDPTPGDSGGSAGGTGASPATSPGRKRRDRDHRGSVTRHG